MAADEAFGKYRRVRLLGRGGFAAVWLCHDPDLDRHVAVKVLADIYALDDEIRERFVQEARILSRLEDERIVRVHTIDELDDGRPYFVADYADRGTLRDRITEAANGQGAMEVGHALRYSTEIGRCLIVAHHHNVIHRDLKPTNVLFRSVPRHRESEDFTELLVLADFGIARAIEDASRLNPVTTAAGTVPYMAPEQVRGQADQRCDLFAATVILYELLSGRAPFEGETDLRIHLMKESSEYPPVSQVRPGLPPVYDQFVERGLSPNPDDRFADAHEFVEAVSALPVVDAGRPVAPPSATDRSTPATALGSGPPVAAAPLSPPPIEPSPEPPVSWVSSPPGGGFPAPGGSQPSRPPDPSVVRSSVGPDADGSSRRGLPTWLIVAGAGLVLGIVVVIMILSGEDSDPTTETTVASRDATTTAPTETSAPVETSSAVPQFLPGHRALLDLLVFPTEDGCVPVSEPGAGIDFQVRCDAEVSGTVFDVSYSTWRNVDELEGSLTGDPEPWGRDGVRLGRRVESVEGPEATIVWTYDRTEFPTSGRAQVPADALDELRVWWSDVGSELNEIPSPSSDELALVGRISSLSGSPTCEIQRGPPQSIASLACQVKVADDETLVMTATEWLTADAMNAYLDGFIGQQSAKVGDWDDEVGEAGTVVRYTEPDPALAWSVDDALITVDAVAPGGPAQPLEDWWLEVRSLQ